MSASGPLVGAPSPSRGPTLRWASPSSAHRPRRLAPPPSRHDVARRTRLGSEVGRIVALRRRVARCQMCLLGFVRLRSAAAIDETTRRGLQTVVVGSAVVLSSVASLGLLSACACCFTLVSQVGLAATMLLHRSGRSLRFCKTQTLAAVRRVPALT